MKFLLRWFRSSRDSGFEYVYVNQDGSVRELSPNEQKYLREIFPPGDGGRPYIKSSYKSLDGWGMSGFLLRKKVPSRITVDPVNPQYDSLVGDNSMISADVMIEDFRVAGFIVETNPDGSVTCAHNPNASPEESEKSYEILRQLELERQRKAEEFAKLPPDGGKHEFWGRDT